MDVILHRLEPRIAAIEALIAQSCIECERLQPDREPDWKMYVTVDRRARALLP